MRRTHSLTISGSAPAVNLSAGYDLTGTGIPCEFRLKLNGSLSLISDGGTSTPAGKWLSSWPDSTNAALYEVRRTQVSGTTGSTAIGTMTDGVWFALSSDRGWQVQSTLGVTRSNVSTWDIRLIAGPGPIVATTTTTLTGDP